MEHTNRYSNGDKNNLQFTVTDNEMMKFIVIIFLSGYNKRTCETDYWSKSPDLECLIVASAMSRTRFQHIKSYLHAADNQNLSETKMAKIEPLYQILNEKFQRYGIFHENLSIDESMVPYFGRHSCKQFIRRKPIRFGYKIWMLASNTGRPYRVAIYQGKGNGGDSDKPLGYRVVTSSLSPCANPPAHHVFFLVVPAHENSFWKRLQSNGYLSSRQNKWLPIEVCQRIQENGQRRVSVLYIR